MKNFSFIIMFFFILGCNLGKDSNTFDSDKLKGRYNVDITPAISETVNADKSEDGFYKMGQIIAVSALTSIKIQISFYDKNTGIMNMDGVLVDLASLLNEPPQKVKPFTYKVENDSIIYMKFENESDFHKWAIVKKYNSSYDYLKLLILDEEGRNYVYYNLTKIN